MTIEVEENDTTQRESSISSTSPSSLSFHGSYKTSLLSRRIHSLPAGTLPFTLMMSIVDLLPRSSQSICPPTKLRLSFSASYYELHGPWVASIDLLQHANSQKEQHAIVVSRRGQLQFLIQNQQGTVIRCLAVPYDVTHLQLGCCTYFRKLWYVGQSSSIRYAVHLQFVCTQPIGGESLPQEDDLLFDMDMPSQRKEDNSIVYLHRDIKLIFAPRAPDPDESLRVEVEGADEAFPWTNWHRPTSSVSSSTKKRHSRGSSLSNVLTASPPLESEDLT